MVINTINTHEIDIQYTAGEYDHIRYRASSMHRPPQRPQLLWRRLRVRHASDAANMKETCWCRRLVCDGHGESASLVSLRLQLERYGTDAEFHVPCHVRSRGSLAPRKRGQQEVHRLCRRIRTAGELWKIRSHLVPARRGGDTLRVSWPRGDGGHAVRLDARRPRCGGEEASEHLRREAALVVCVCVELEMHTKFSR